MPSREGRERRAVVTLAPERREAGGEPSYRVPGYATTFDEPYVLWGDVRERVSREAFDDDTDMSDVIMQFDHAGKVLARTSNGTLELTVDDHGLRVDADLSKSQAARDTFEEIENELVTRMSFCFRVDREEWDETEQLRTIKHFSKIYDVSAVSIPANGATEISARGWADGAIRRARDGAIARARARARLRLIGAQE